MTIGVEYHIAKIARLEVRNIPQTKRIEANSHHIPGQHAYAVDKESPSALSEREARGAKNRCEPIAKRG
jgi:hypothetical protein